MKRVELPNKNGCNFRINPDSILPISEEIEEFITLEPSLKKIKFKNQIPKDIQSNNIIEGIDNDLEAIRRIIVRKIIYDISRDSSDKEKKVLNLYKAYKYILEKKEINKENLRTLYRLISDGLILPRDQECMGDYYREDEVCISNLAYFDERIMGIPFKDVSKYVDYLMEYVKNAKAENYTDNFIISQIIHFYLIFIHPYFDCNGRTSRTVAMWYLLNNNANAFLNFNRAIPFTKSKYNKSINSSRDTSDLTYFIKYMLEMEMKQLEKEYLISSVERSRGKNFTDDEYLLLEYFLSNKQNQSLKSLTDLFTTVNGSKMKVSEVASKLEPFMKSGLIIQIGSTKTLLNDGTPNPILRLNADMFDFNRDRVKTLDLSNYLNK